MSSLRASFGSQARCLQANFRDSSRTISDLARNPDDELGRQHDYYLALGCENENLYPTIRGKDGAIAFFKERSIKWWRSGQSGDTPGENIPSRNMASSQILCVNFLLPIAAEKQALIALLKSIDSDVVEVRPLSYEAGDTKCSSFVEFEWIGLSTSLELGPYTRGANATSVDALLVARTSMGINRAYLFEWKYTEEYQIGARLAGGETANETRRKRYSKWFDAKASPFEESELDDWLYDPLYQIMRLILLTRKMIEEREFDVDEARVIVACPRENFKFRQRVTSPKMKTSFPEDDLRAAVMRRLKDPRLFDVVAIEDLYDAITLSSGTGIADDWATYQKERYGWKPFVNG